MGSGEILVILVVVLILFGGKRLPEFAQSLGKGIREKAATAFFVVLPAISGLVCFRLIFGSVYKRIFGLPFYIGNHFDPSFRLSFCQHGKQKKKIHPDCIAPPLPVCRCHDYFIIFW